MLAVITAMQREADALLCRCAAQRSYRLCGKTVVLASACGREFHVVVCGVGKVNAAAGAQMEIDKLEADALLNIGVAGGISPRTALGKVFAIEKAVQYDFDLSQLNQTKIGTLDEYDSPYLPVLAKSAFPLATLATGDRFNDSTQDLALLNDELYADIRDMEGGAIAQVALSAKVPLYMYKAISDVVGGDCVQQYRDNLARALGALTAAVPQIFSEVK